MVTKIIRKHLARISKEIPWDGSTELCSEEVLKLVARSIEQTLQDFDDANIGSEAARRVITSKVIERMVECG